MHAEIYVDEKWGQCDFEYPYRPDLADVSLPLGMRTRQGGLSARYNARIIMPLRGPVIPTGKYLVRQRGQHYRVEICDVKNQHHFGNATLLAAATAAAVPG